MKIARWTPEEDALLLPGVKASMSRITLEQIAAKLGRTYNAAKSRLDLLRNPDRGNRPGEARKRRNRKPNVVAAQNAAGNTRTRKCSYCRVEFTFNPARENFFRCEAHRGMTSWLAEGGSRGGQRGRVAL